MTDTPARLDAANVLKLLLHKFAEDNLHTSIPGEIVSYNATTRRASVRPVIKTWITDVLTELPILQDVPVHFVGGGGYNITHDLSEGDCGGLVMSERGIAEWLETGNISTPGSKRHHSFSDAWFIPGLYPTGKVPTYTHSGDGITIANDADSVHMKLTSSGVEVKGDLSVTGDITTTLGEVSGATVKAGFGPVAVGLGTHTHTSATPGSPTSAPTPGS